MSDSTNAIFDEKQIKSAANYSMGLLKQLNLADQIVKNIQDLTQCGEGDEMLEQYKKCSEKNKKCFGDCMNLLADYTEGLLEKKALAEQIIKRIDAGEFAN